jgi:hypothetical protein
MFEKRSIPLNHWDASKGRAKGIHQNLGVSPPERYEPAFPKFLVFKFHF